MSTAGLRRTVGVASTAIAVLLVAGCSTGAGGTDPASSAGATPGDSGITSTTLPSTSAVEPPPSAFPTPEASFLASLEGTSQSAAEQAAAAAGFTTRIVSVDGVGRPVTMDYRSDRINLEIVGGKVTKATAG